MRFKFAESPVKDPETLIKSYQHVDNGGFSIGVDVYDTLTIDVGFFGYSNTQLLLSNVDIDGLINVLQTAKKRKEEYNVVQRLKGED